MRIQIRTNLHGKQIQIDIKKYVNIFINRIDQTILNCLTSNLILPTEEDITFKYLMSIRNKINKKSVSNPNFIKSVNYLCDNINSYCFDGNDTGDFGTTMSLLFNSISI